MSEMSASLKEDNLYDDEAVTEILTCPLTANTIEAPQTYILGNMQGIQKTLSALVKGLSTLSQEVRSLQGICNERHQKSDISALQLETSISGLYKKLNEEYCTTEDINNYRNERDVIYRESIEALDSRLQKLERQQKKSEENFSSFREDFRITLKKLSDRICKVEEDKECLTEVLQNVNNRVENKLTVLTENFTSQRNMLEGLKKQTEMSRLSESNKHEVAIKERTQLSMSVCRIEAEVRAISNNIENQQKKFFSDTILPSIDKVVKTVVDEEMFGRVDVDYGAGNGIHTSLSSEETRDGVDHINTGKKLLSSVTCVAKLDAMLRSSTLSGEVRAVSKGLIGVLELLNITPETLQAVLSDTSYRTIIQKSRDILKTNDMEMLDICKTSDVTTDDQEKTDYIQEIPRSELDAVVIDKVRHLWTVMSEVTPLWNANWRYEFMNKQIHDAENSKALEGYVVRNTGARTDNEIKKIELNSENIEASDSHQSLPSVHHQEKQSAEKSPLGFIQNDEISYNSFFPTNITMDTSNIPSTRIPLLGISVAEVQYSCNSDMDIMRKGDTLKKRGLSLMAASPNKSNCIYSRMITVVVIDVETCSPGFHGGLQEGDIVITAYGKAITTIKSFLAALVAFTSSSASRGLTGNDSEIISSYITTPVHSYYSGIISLRSSSFGAVDKQSYNDHMNAGISAGHNTLPLIIRRTLDGPLTTIRLSLNRR